MATVENINKLAKYLKINAGQVATGEDNVNLTSLVVYLGYNLSKNHFLSTRPDSDANHEIGLDTRLLQYSAQFRPRAAPACCG